MADNYDGKIVISAEVDASSAISDLQKLEVGINECSANLVKICSDISSSFSSTGDDFSKWVSSSVDIMASHTDSIGKNLSSSFDISFSALGDTCSEMTLCMEETFNALYENIFSNCGLINETVAISTALIQNGFEEVELYDVGSNIVAGLIKGLEAKLAALRSVVSTINSVISNTMTGYFQINSPSRLTTSYGKYIGEGLVNGIKSSEKDVMASAVSLSKSIDAGLTKSISSGIDISGDLLMPTMSTNIDTSSVSSIGSEASYTGGSSATEKTVIYKEMPINISSMTVRDDSDIYSISKELASLSSSNMYSRTGTVSY